MMMRAPIATEGIAAASEFPPTESNTTLTPFFAVAFAMASTSGLVVGSMA